MNKIYYNETNYNEDEILAVVETLKEQPHTLVGGKYSEIFEKKISNIFGKKYGVFVNSGSSANLLALASLNLPKGTEVITPALTFSTTISPILQLGLIPSLIDIDVDTLNIKSENIESAINNNTSAIMIPNLIGNLPNLKKISEIAKKYSLPFIEDSADTIGHTYEGQNTGKLSDLVTTSFYASHIITCAGIGGMICTNDKDIYENIVMLRGWGRSSELYSADSLASVDENLKDRFNIKINEMTYDRKFVFQKKGYNFFAPEICAAFGCKQLEKFDFLFEKRSKNFDYIKSSLKKMLSNQLIFPKDDKNIKTIWLAYPIILNEEINASRTDLQLFLEKKNIQTRPIFSGNITRQPMLAGEKFKTNNSNFENADYIMKNGMLVGCHPKLNKQNLDYICSSIKDFFDR